MNKAERKDNTHLVLKNEDIYRYLRREQIEAIEDACATIVQGRTDEGKPINDYIVCNRKEPYADKIWQMILQGEDAKTRSTKRRSTSSLNESERIFTEKY